MKSSVKKNQSNVNEHATSEDNGASDHFSKTISANK